MLAANRNRRFFFLFFWRGGRNVPLRCSQVNCGFRKKISFLFPLCSCEDLEGVLTWNIDHIFTNKSPFTKRNGTFVSSQVGDLRASLSMAESRQARGPQIGTHAGEHPRTKRKEWELINALSVSSEAHHYLFFPICYKNGIHRVSNYKRCAENRSRLQSRKLKPMAQNIIIDTDIAIQYCLKGLSVFFLNTKASFF